jgi:hypothetical protein
VLPLICSCCRLIVVHALSLGACALRPRAVLPAHQTRVWLVLLSQPVCVCVCEREGRDRESERGGREKGRETEERGG